jgi:hypothetical protein
MIQLRTIELEKDHPMLARWWTGHGWNVVPAVILPKLGVIAEMDGEDMAAAFLYMDNSVGVCWLEWLVTNPSAKPFPAIRCVSQVIGFLRERALELDYGVMMTTCRQSSLARLYERNGFQKTDSGVTHLMMQLREPETS